MPRRKDINYAGVAKYQRLVQVCVLAFIAMIILPVVVTFAGLPIPPQFARFMLVSTGFLYWGVMIAGLVIMILLMVAQRRHPFSIVLLSIGMFIPIINILVLLHVNSEASSLLKARGARVGFFGVAANEVPKLLPGNCAGCGYSRQGLPPLAPCPECARVPEVR